MADMGKVSDMTWNDYYGAGLGRCWRTYNEAGHGCGRPLGHAGGCGPGGLWLDGSAEDQGGHDDQPPVDRLEDAVQAGTG
jgi:hypothetical protein